MFLQQARTDPSFLLPHNFSYIYFFATGDDGFFRVLPGHGSPRDRAPGQELMSTKNKLQNTK